MGPGKVRGLLRELRRKFNRFFGLPSDEQARVKINCYRIVRVLLHLRAILVDQRVPIDYETTLTNVLVTSLQVEAVRVFLQQLLDDRDLPLAYHHKGQVCVIKCSDLTEFFLHRRRRFAVVCCALRHGKARNEQQAKESKAAKGSGD